MNKLEYWNKSFGCNKLQDKLQKYIFFYHYRMKPLQMFTNWEKLMPIQPKEFQMRNPNPKVYHLSSFNQSHGSKDFRFLLWLVKLKYDQFLGSSSLDLDLSFEFSFKDPRSYRLNITFVSFALNGKLQEIGTVNGAMFQMCNGSFQGKNVEIY